jgi:hypothetical protein
MTRLLKAFPPLFLLILACTPPCVAPRTGTRGVVPTSEEVARLIARVEAGDECQTDWAVSLLPNLSGGNLEDTMRAIGAATAHHPVVFLRVMESRHLADNRIESIIRMLPLSSVDNDAEKLRLVRERIAALRTVTDPRLRRVRDVTISFLSAYEQELH